MLFFKLKFNANKVMKNTDKINYQIDEDILKFYHFNMKLCTITDTSYLISFFCLFSLIRKYLNPLIQFHCKSRIIWRLL